MVLWPVELDATRDPRTCQAHQSRFDDVIIIDKMTLLDLVVGHLNTSAQLWQYHHLDIFILQIDGLPFFIYLLVRD